MNKVTILLPNFNNAPYIQECLESIKNQSYTDFKLLIIDDGSTDNGIDIIKNFKDERIELFLKVKNSGIIDTLNLGLSKICTDYIVRMDGDDYMHKDRLLKLVKFMENNPEVGVCGSGIQHFGISNESISYSGNSKMNSANLIFNHSIGHASVIYRTKTLKDNKILYTKGYNYIEDYKIFLDLDKVTTMTSIPDLLYYYRREEYNNFKNLDTKNAGFLKIYEEILSKLKFDSPEKSALTHFQLGQNTLLTENKKHYKKHISKLKSANRVVKLFPEKELEIVLDNVIDQLFYRLADQSKLAFTDGLEFFVKSPKKIYYYIKSLK